MNQPKSLNRTTHGIQWGVEYALALDWTGTLTKRRRLLTYTSNQGYDNDVDAHDNDVHDLFFRAIMLALTLGWSIYLCFIIGKWVFSKKSCILIFKIICPCFKIVRWIFSVKTLIRTFKIIYLCFIKGKWVFSVKTFLPSNHLSLLHHRKVSILRKKHEFLFSKSSVYAS